MKTIKQNIKIIFKCLLLYFILVNTAYSQYGNSNLTGNTDEYGFYSQNGILTNLSSPGKYASVPHNFVLNQGLQGTVEAWVYLTSYNINNTCIYEKGSSFMFGVGTSFVFNRPILRISNTALFPQTGDAVPLNRWVHLAATWLQTGANINASFYVDGALIGTQFQAVNVSGNTDSVTIGGSKIQSSSFVNGYLDEVRYWNRERTGAEISRNRFCGIGDGLVANQNSALVSAEDYSGLVSSWTFNQDGITCPDYISNQTAYYRGAAVTGSNIQGQPIPYNLAAFFPGGVNDYIKVPDNSVFDLLNVGTIEAWVYCIPGATGYTVISKGATAASTTFRVYIQNNGVLSLQIGSASNVAGAVPFQQWAHIAVTWALKGGSYTAKFYINGKFVNQVPINSSMPVNADPVRIGNLQWDANNNFHGYMDEVRIWDNELSPEMIKAYMFTSSKTGGSFFSSYLAACWNFEGNLNNTTTVPDINGTFNIGALNKCRFSGYGNESNTGQIANSFIPHTTVINRNESPVNSFPGGFSIRAPYKNLFYDTFQYDTINIPGNVPISSLEVFLSINQPLVSNLTAYLKAPNGVEKVLVSGNGGSGGNILTFFKDGAPPVTSFNNPWSYLAGPLEAFGNFGGANAQGNWILRIIHGNLGFTGTLLGWGIRVNNTVTAIEPGIIPEKFSLEQNYPNPFNPSTKIKFDIAKGSNVRITIYDILGKEVRVLVNENLKAGKYEADFDASFFSSGTYFYKIEAGNFSAIRKMVFIK